MDFEDRPLLAQVLKDIQRQITQDVTRPCVECTRVKLTEGTWGTPRQEALQLIVDMKSDDERWVRRDIKVQKVVGRDPTVTYQLTCGHWVIDF